MFAVYYVLFDLYVGCFRWCGVCLFAFLCGDVALVRVYLDLFLKCLRIVVCLFVVVCFAGCFLLNVYR